MTVNVRFVDNHGHIPEALHPVPAKAYLPEWYKKIASYHQLPPGETADSGRKRGEGSTIKKCMPVFDAITSGYIIFTPQDVRVTWTKEFGHYFEWPHYEFIGFHPQAQAEGHPKDDKSGAAFPKFRNPWSVITPKGYSCMFVQPMHRDAIFEIMPGVVDTDMHHGAVQLPFTFKDKTWEGTIPAGTPMAQVIPFKREQYTHTVENVIELGYGPNEIANAQVRSKFINAYREFFWEKKDYS